MNWFLNFLIRNVIEREIKREKVQMKPTFKGAAFQSHRWFYYDLLVASSFYYSLLCFWCECEPRSHGWGVLSCCSCLLFYRLTHGSFAGPHLRGAPSCSENYLKQHELVSASSQQTAPVSCLTLHSTGPCPLYWPPPPSPPLQGNNAPYWSDEAETFLLSVT